MIQNFRLCDKIIGIKLSQKYNARVCKIKFNKQLNNKKEQWHKAQLFNLKPNLQTILVCVIIEKCPSDCLKQFFYYFKILTSTLSVF